MPLTAPRARARAHAKGTYVYCVVQARRMPSVEAAPPGPPGLGPHRVLDGGDGLWLVAADAPLPRFGEAAIQRGLRNLTWLSRCAVAHEAVVEHCLRFRTVVPMKLFTLFDNDIRALAEIRRRRRQLDRTVERVGGRREWGVRIRDSGAPAVAGVRRPATGAGYLAAKRQARDAQHARAAIARSGVDKAFAALAAVAADAERRPVLEGVEVKTRLLLDAAFLVPIGATARFLAATGRLARDLGRDACSLEVTGPWPPYSFIES